jgi:hypothetical protein
LSNLPAKHVIFENSLMNNVYGGIAGPETAAVKKLPQGDKRFFHKWDYFFIFVKDIRCMTRCGS